MKGRSTFEISDCPIQRTATTEKSGPCPEMGTAIKLDNSIDNNMIKSQTATDKSSEPTPIHSNLDDSFEQVESTDPEDKSACCLPPGVTTAEPNLSAAMVHLQMLPPVSVLMVHNHSLRH